MTRQYEPVMSHSEKPPSNGWIPAWKRLEFQLTGPTPSSYPQYYKRYYPNPPWYLQQTNSESSNNTVAGTSSIQGDGGDQKFDKQKKRKFDQTTLSNAIESSGRASEPERNRSKLDLQQGASQNSSTAENVSIQFKSSLKFQTLLTLEVYVAQRTQEVRQIYLRDKGNRW